MTWFYSEQKRAEYDRQLAALYWAVRELMLAIERLSSAFEVEPADLKMREADLVKAFNPRDGSP